VTPVDAITVTQRTEQFDEGIRSITQRRGEDYGHPLENFELISRMQDCVAWCDDPAMRHALDMICVKMVRLVQTPDHIDSILDIAGYARTMAMILDDRENQDATR
tara:strand:+ start:95 stop:409 length:315 start_codon:yes stop_codon:yes gene_type:complete